MTALSSNGNGSVYLLPSSTTSKEEADRLNEQHIQLKQLVENQLTLAPISDDIETVLDLGCGTGIWAQEFAKAYPNTKVIGADMAPPTFPEGALPPNLSFVAINAEEEWKLDQKFDLIHIRLLTLGMRDWPKLFKRCHDALKPGGWLQTLDPILEPRCGNGKDAKNTSLYKSLVIYKNGIEAVGIDPLASEHHEGHLKDAGFTRSQKFIRRSHIGSWKETVAAEKNYGSFPDYVFTVSSTRKLASHHAPEWTKEEEERLWSEAVQEIAESDTKYNFYHDFIIFIAQK